MLTAISPEDSLALAHLAAALLMNVLLDVPFMAQPPDLCGGAAVAMVMRYWGTTDVYPKDFAPLVNRDAAGIPTGALAAAVRDRGWQSYVHSPEAAAGREEIRSALAAGHPLIALIEVAPATYHYVVVVGATEDQIVVHDPARAPFRVMPWREFDRAWSVTERWLLLMLPPSGSRTAADMRAAPRPPTSADTLLTPCKDLTQHGVDLAVKGDTANAEQSLVAATVLCPNDPAPLRELAGLRFSERRWNEAEALAQRAIALAPSDPYAWQLTATSRYVSGRTMDALAAWNRAGEPRIDTIAVSGAERTPQPALERAMRIEPGDLLTPETLERAERRLNDVPAVSNARIRYTPIDGGRAQLSATIDERPRVPHGWRAAAMIGVRALFNNEVRVPFGGVLGRGDLLYVGGRWIPGRQRIDGGLAMPAPGRLPGVLSFDVAWEKQTYAVFRGTEEPQPTELETRRRAGLSLSDWATNWLRWQAGAALDRFDGRTYFAVDGTLEVQLHDDRVAASVTGGWWTANLKSDPLMSISGNAAWRSTADATRRSAMVRTGVYATTAQSPRALWTGADTGVSRGPLLRAHPLMDDDVINGEAFGRSLAAATGEVSQPLPHTPLVNVSIAAFIDGARAWHRGGNLPATPLYVDAGLGLRIRLPGEHSLIRVDLAHGLNGGRFVVSAGWVTNWFK